MISSNSRRVLALATSSLMVGASFVMASAPANAAGGITVEPTTGVEYAVFNDDQFALSAVVNGLSVSSDATLAYQITNVDQHTLGIDFETFAATSQNASFEGLKSTGESVEVLTSSAVALSNTTATARADNNTNISGYVVVDFLALDITTLIIHGMDFTGDTTPKFQILEDTATANNSGMQKNDDALNLIDGSAAAGVLSRSGLNDGNSSITVQAWVDSNSDVTDVDASTASAVETITFYDPSNVSIISKVERLRATGRTFGADIETVTDAVSRQDLLMSKDGSTTSNALVGSLKFSQPINFAQIDMSDIGIGMASTNAATTTMARAAIIELGSSSDALDTVNQVEELTASNGKSADKNNEYLFRAFANGAIFAAGDKYSVSFQHLDTDALSQAAPVYNSPQFTVSSQTIDAGLDVVAVTVSPTADSSAASGTVSLRSGVKAFTYTAQMQDSPADIEEANIPVTVRVSAGSFLPAGEVLSVSGTTQSIDQANEAVFVSGLTNADGQFSVTVTAVAGAAATDYSVQFYGSGGATPGAWIAATAQTATYASANASTLKADNSVISAASPTLTFSVADAFGVGVSKSATGKQYSVELKAPNTTNLKAYGVVAADGTVSFSFTNWLKLGESDVLTAKLYTGTSTAPTSTDYVSGKTANVTLYASTAAKSVIFSADDVSSAAVEYNDFITGKKAKVGPTTGTNSSALTGTVVDANGAGIPGAPVTLSAEGIQFLTGTTFSIGSVDLVTDAAGSFTVEAWTHVKTATGVTVTATSGALTDTMLIKADLPGTLDRANLVFSTDLPASVVYNTTYAVTGSVVDVWGNPVDGAVVAFDGFGGANFNGVSSVTRTTDRNGEATAYLRSIKDVDGLSAIEISVTSVDHNGGGADVANIASVVATDVATTSWDETSWTNLFTKEVNFLKVAAPSSSQKVNAGSFKGYVAVYALGYEGLRLSAKVGNDWVIVPVIPAASNDLYRHVEFVGAGVDIAVRIYIDRVLVETINLVTK
jgi:hypothetical protein